MKSTDVATKRDLAHLRELIEAKFETIRAEMAAMRQQMDHMATKAEFERGMRQQTRIVLGAVLAVAGLPYLTDAIR